MNGAPQDAEAPRDWMTLERRWQAGDVIDIVFPMAVRVGQLDDGDSWSHFPLTIEYGPLVFALPIPEKWTPIPGHPRTPLPEGWHWWNVEPVLRNDPRGDQYEQQGLRKFNISWNTALDPAIAPEDIAVERRVEDGYVWEHPRLKLHLKGYKALFAYPPYPCKNLEVSMSPIDVYGGMDLELVPYGCTALRITYFTRARLPEKPMPWPGVLE